MNKISMLINNTSCDISDFTNEIIASINANGTIPEDLADVFTVEIFTVDNELRARVDAI